MLKKTLIVLAALLVSLMAVAVIFYVTAYIPRSEGVALAGKIQWILTGLLALFIGIMIFKEKKLSEVADVDEMYHRFDVRMMSLLLSVAVMFPLAFLLKRALHMDVNDWYAYGVVLTTMIFDALVVRKLVAQYLFQKIYNKKIK